MPVAVPLARLVRSFLKIGAIGFGGGMAMVALMERDLVERDRLIEPEEFLHGVGLGQILGPFAVNTAFFIGYRLRGLVGGLTATVAFLAPSVSLVVVLAHYYFRYHTVPALQAVLAGLGPVVIALILSAAWSMGRKAVTSRAALLLAIGAAVAGAFKVNALAVLVAAGAVGLGANALRRRGPRRSETPSVLGPTSRPAPAIAPVVAFGAASSGAPLTALAATFGKVGLVFFGGGFVLVPILQQVLVVQTHWLSTREFLDGVALSNLTPGPIAVLATFAGFRVAGVSGALVATVALFAPALALMAALCAAYARHGSSKQAQHLLAAVSPAVVGLVASAALLLGPAALTSWGATLLCGVALVLLVRLRAPPALALAIGGLLGWMGLVR